MGSPPVYSAPVKEDSFTPERKIVTGDYDTQIVGEFGSQHVSDKGSIQLRLGDTVNRIDFTLMNRTSHNNLVESQDGLQTFPFSIGDLNFTYDAIRD